MKLSEIIAAYAAAESLLHERMDFGTAAALVQLRAELKPVAEYYLQEERRLMLRYAEQDETGHVVYTGPNTFSFADPKDAPAYAEQRRRLAETDTDIRYDRRRCPAPPQISPGAIEALGAFIDFEVN